MLYCLVHIHSRKSCTLQKNILRIFLKVIFSLAFIYYTYIFNPNKENETKKQEVNHEYKTKRVEKRIMSETKSSYGLRLSFLRLERKKRNKDQVEKNETEKIKDKQQNKTGIKDMNINRNKEEKRNKNINSITRSRK